MHFSCFLLIFFISVLIKSTVSDGNSIPSYLVKLQELRRGATEQQNKRDASQRPATGKINSSKKKTNRYKCVLMDEDDEFLINDVRNSKHSFIKVIPQDEDEKFKIINSPSFASEIRQNSNEEAFEDVKDEFFYLTSTTPVPLNGSLSIKKLITSKAQEVDSTTRRNLTNQRSRLPVAQGIPLRNVIKTNAANVPLIDINLKHVETPVSESAKTHRTEHMQSQQQRRRFIANSSSTTPPQIQLSGQQLVLGEQHCKLIMHYAALYNVKDVKGWVHHNCAFAKMYLPNATCEEIDILVASCFK